jgi:hypothetical protein
MTVGHMLEERSLLLSKEEILALAGKTYTKARLSANM